MRRRQILAMQAMTPDEFSRLDFDALALAAAEEGTTCPKCGKALKKRGAHLHINRCKGHE